MLICYINMLRVDFGESAQGWMLKPYLGMKVWELRHLAVNHFIDAHQLRRVLDLGCSEGCLLQRLSRCHDIEVLVGMDIDDQAISKAVINTLSEPIQADIQFDREVDQVVTIFKGDISKQHPQLLDYKFDLVTLIEVIQHLPQEHIAPTIHNIFAFVRPPFVLITTPNSQFNVFFAMKEHQMRHWDHKFEWNRQQFTDFCLNVCSKYGYQVKFSGVGEHVEDSSKGYCSQIAQFELIQKPAHLGNKIEQKSTTVNKSWRHNIAALMTNAFYKSLYSRKENGRITWEKAVAFFKKERIGKNMHRKMGVDIDESFLRSQISKLGHYFEWNSYGYELRSRVQSESEESSMQSQS